MSVEPDRANVLTMPPFIYIGFFLLGIGLQYLWPIKLLSLTAQLTIGLGLVAISFIMVGQAIPRFRKAGTSFDVNTPTTTIITDGAYKYSRNPIYLSMAVLHAGLAIALDNIWALIMLAPALVMIHAGIILPEERYLTGKFGEQYLQYKRQVRRWI